MTTTFNPVCWFEIPCADIARAQDFYETTFDVRLSLNEMGPCQMAWFPMQDAAVGCTGSLVRGPGYQPSAGGSLVYFTTADLDVTMNRALKAGGKVLQARTEIGQYVSIAIVEDSEGNRIGLHQAP